MISRFFKLFCCFLVLTIHVQAAPRIEDGTFIRDAEIESLMRDIIEPIFKVAGLNHRDLKLYIIADPRINAAASVDNSIFINTGLITNADSIDEVIGVLAHETGHIALGHVVRTMDTLKKASLLSLAGFVLGLAAAIGGAGPDAVMGGMMAGQSMAMGMYFHYSQGQEASADQAAIRYLHQLNWTNEGLESFMSKLASDELRAIERRTAYARTHPLSSDRVEMIHNTVKNKPRGDAIPKGIKDKFDRIKTKIEAYMTPPPTVLMRYPERRQDTLAKYARAIAHYRQSDLQGSLKELNQLIAAAPKDGFLYDLRGQIYFELGHLEPAFQDYKKAVAIHGENSLIRLAYAQVALESGHASLQSVLKDVFFVLNHEPKNATAWQFLAIIYGRLNRIDLAAMALAEKELAMAEPDRALRQAKRALTLTKSHQVKIRAKDIIEMVEAAQNKSS